MRLAATAALVAVLAVVGGCGGDEETTAPSATSETTSVPRTTAADDGGKQEDDFFVERDEHGQSESDLVSDPETVLDLYFTSGDPDLACGDLATERLLSSAYGDEKGCRQAQVPAATPDAIEIKELNEAGNEATAIVIPDGGPNDGIETDVVLVNDGEGWLVDSLEADVPAGP